jgi:HEAT repeat protein
MAKEYNFDPRTSGAIALGKMANKDNKEVYQALLDGTEDQELQVRESSILALGLLGNKEAMGRLDKILTAADKKEVTERFFAAVALGIIGDNAILPTLKEIISKEKLKEVKVGAVIAIGLMKNEEHIPYLLKISESKNQDDMVRAAAISAIGKIGTFEYIDKNKKVNIIKSLSEMVEEKQTSDIVKMSVINAFADVCDKNTLDTVYGWYNKEKDNLARGFMVMAMAKIYTISEDESSKKEVWKLISTEIEKGPFNVRGFCAVAFGIMKDKRAYKILKDRFDNVKDPMIRSSVAVGLGLLGEKSAVPTLLEEIGANSKSTDDLQAYCALALGMIHKADSTPDPQIVEALVLAIKDGKKKPNWKLPHQAKPGPSRSKRRSESVSWLPGLPTGR